MEEQKNENQEQQSNQSQDEAPKEQQSETPSQSIEGGSKSTDEHKALAILGYLLPVLFFVPLLTDAKNDPFAKFHANQHLVLLIAWIVVNIVASFPFIGWFLLGPIGITILIVFMILGIIHAAQGEMKEMPLIGGIQILK
ncbi:MAG: DUF4870 domain-containing protein [Candidatus Moranbacteria bacterium]|nr:DUF4870 domain-containing protein [Candidatus Moranbacteria bacterium]